MSLLVYCILDADAQVEIPSLGVQSAPIAAYREVRLQCLASQFFAPKVGGQAHVRESALVFNRVLQALLEQAAIIPFRFPTIVAEEQEISAYLRDREGTLISDLARFRDMVQMEILIQTGSNSDVSELVSGKDYLRAKQVQLRTVEKVLSHLKQALAPYTEEWRLRESVDRVRGYVLVKRESIRNFREAARGIVVPGPGKVRITGPWPVSEFLASHD